MEKLIILNCANVLKNKLFNSKCCYAADPAKAKHPLEEKPKYQFQRKVLPKGSSWNQTVLETKTDEVGKILIEFANKYQVPGLSLAVSHKTGKIGVFDYGNMDVGTLLPVVKRTKFRLGEITMTLVAYSALKTAKEIDGFLDDLIKIYIPDLKNVQDESQPPYGIKIRELLNHTSGFKEFDNDTKTWLGSERTQYPKKLHPSLVRNYFDEHHYHKDNKGKYKLSQHGYNLLGWICAQADSENHGSVNKYYQYMFQDLGLYNTALDFSLFIRHKRSKHYVRNDGGILEPVPYQDPGVFPCAHGFMSNSEDLVLFATKLYLLRNDDQIGKIFHPIPSQNDYSMFGEILRDDGAVWRWSKTLGASNFIYIKTGNAIDDGLVVGLLTNLGNIPDDALKILMQKVVAKYREALQS